MRVLSLLALLAPAVAFMPMTPAGRMSTKLNAAHVKAGGDYTPGVVNYGASTDDIIQTLDKKGNFKTLLTALEAAGLKDALKKDAGVFTLYAPNDAAFAKLPAGALDGLLADKTKLADVLKYHVVPLVVKDKESIRAFRLSNKPTLQGGRVRINVRPNPDGEQFVIFNNGEANIGEADIDAANGTVHEIDGVLTPQAGTVIPPK